MRYDFSGPAMVSLGSPSMLQPPLHSILFQAGMGRILCIETIQGKSVIPEIAFSTSATRYP